MLGLPVRAHGSLLPLHPGLVVQPALPSPRFQPGAGDGLVDRLPCGVDKAEIAERVAPRQRHSSSPPDITAKSPTVSTSNSRAHAIAIPTATHWWTAFAQAHVAVQVWIEDYNRERPHQSLGNRTASEVRAAALTPTNPQPDVSMSGGVITAEGSHRGNAPIMAG
jgi:hypothetical protein